MTIRVFVQNEAGSNRKNYHDEKTLVFRRDEIVSHQYPFPYGFVIGTEAGDGCNVDCFVITDRILRTGQVVECEPIGLLEQFEDGVVDHNVLARLLDDDGSVSEHVESALTEHVLECFRHVSGKRISVGRFLDARDAQAHITSHREPG
ncbi:MAG: inorganic diphosphatase [Acidobacteria bacterium]|nr:inorganic diphosphatase [Acidobacteriota bacterium]